MPTSIDRIALQRLIDERDVQLAEVLPREEYEWAHLPGAVHLPLKQLSRELADRVLVRERPVVVYCNGSQ